MNNKNVKLVIYIVSIMVIFTIVFIVLNNLLKNKEKGYDEYLKNYKVNEYIPTYVSDEDMAKIYLKEKTEENKEEVERTVIKEPTQISLLEIDDELRKVDDILNL